MKITVVRDRLAKTSTLGRLLVDGEFFCYTLERRPDAPEAPSAPAGSYALTVEPTHNARLWTPRQDRHLPRLHDVPGRTGILVHAGNTSADTVGCVILGRVLGADSVGASRPALVALMGRLEAAQGPHRAVIIDPLPVRPS